MRPFVRPRIVGALLCLLVLAGIEVPTASAHEFEATRTISLGRRPTGRVPRRTIVKFFGRVRSDEKQCYANELVLLIRVGSGIVASDMTDSSGNYLMKVRVKRTATYLAHVPGAAGGVHPHRHVCYGAKSNTVRVRVR